MISGEQNNTVNGSEADLLLSEWGLMLKIEAS